ncbi:hypothetical protein C7447_101965 [Tenacibaculum adriaticum]|uniref:Uncharacterized protein n=1 Tax=Tenacibaculum adriaticum TaxID=413713 RepID=A0A5S5E026_9FLAO|nr:hypothetical protein [Tenacibaculum adriaticum]TYQ00353.1 hypothetical protein C7447_101965 [Tenacibaculum adriaticum]
MSVHNLQIDEALKLRLDFLLNEFESYRLQNVNISKKKQKVTSQKQKEIEEKKVSFLKSFFFSEFNN